LFYDRATKWPNDRFGFKVIDTDTYLIDGEEWTGKEMELD